MAKDDEEDRLRTVALQNAQSILHARLQEEEALREQSELLRITLSSIGDGVITTDAQGRVTFINVVAEEMTGWSNAEAYGQPLTEIFRIVNEHTRQPVENPALCALREGIVAGLANHTVLISKQGMERHIDDSAAPIRSISGVIVGAVLVFRDVTARKDAEETQSRLAAIVEFSEDAIVSKTFDGIIRTWNSGAERLFGYTSEEAIGKSITIIIPPERRDEENEILARVSRGERIEHFDTVRINKDGNRIDISLTVSPIRNSAGELIGASKVARNISERKRIEAELQNADRRKDQFIALLAHELRNPLAPLRNGLQAMRLASHDKTTVDQLRGMMERQLGHMVRLIDDLLDVSRITQNKMELRRARILLSDVISSAIETARPVIESAGHQLNVILPSRSVALDADITRLAQVFSNLLTNSAKYTEPGGTIWVEAELQDHEVVITVRDNGTGIPSEALPRIFDMFSQADRSIERSAGGLGIGLSLVKGLVEMHGGSVRAKSEGQGKGSLFTVKLPLLSEQSELLKPKPLDSATTAQEPERRFLVVDDNRDSATSMAMMLELRGNKVVTGHDGIEAVKLAKEFQPEVILMDLGMPVMNGYEATRRIREQPWGASIIIVALTGWGQQGDREMTKSAGCDGHLVKPVSLIDLENLLRELQNARAQQSAGTPAVLN